MIQRLQSFYLVLTTLLGILFLSGEIVRFSDGINELFINLQGLSRHVENSGTEIVEKHLHFTILMLLVPFLSLVLIMFYKNRKLQMKLTIILILLILVQIIAVTHYSFQIINNMGAELIPGLKLIIPVLMLILAYLAYRGIKKDENLVRSYDRLR